MVAMMTRIGESGTGPEGSPAALGFKYLLAIVPALAAGVLLTLDPIDTPLLQPDSPGYLDFAPNRTAGYPLFLHLVMAVFGEVRPLVYVQVWLFALSLAYLAVELLRLTGSAVVAAAISLAIAMVPQIHAFHFSVLTESVFISLTLVVLAQFAVLARDTSILRWVVLSGATGLAVAIRPAGLSLVPLIALALVFHWASLRQRVLPVLAAAILPFALVLGAEHLIYHERHGPVRDSPAGSHFFAKAGLLEVDGAVSTPPALAGSEASRRLLSMLDADLRELRRFLAGSPSFAVRQVLLPKYEVFLQYRFAYDERQLAEQETGLEESELLMELAMARLSEAPLAYLGLTWDHYRGLWSTRPASHPDSVPLYRAYIEAKRPIPFESEVRELLESPRPLALARLERPALQVIAVLSLGIAVVALALWLLSRRVAGAFCVAALCAFMVHGHFVLVALTGVGIARYRLTMWPAMVIAIALASWAAMERFGPRGLVAFLRRV